MYYIGTVVLHGVAFIWLSSQAIVKKFRKSTFLKSLLEYRELKVYEKVLNSCAKSRILLVTALVVPGWQILLCYTAMKLLHSEHANKFEANLFLWAYI